MSTLTSTDYVERTTELVRNLDGWELLPHAYRLLSDGEPVALEGLAAAIGWPLEQVETALGEQLSAERDDQGRLVGFGLTLRPTPHCFTTTGRTLYAWCATDTLWFPLILGRAGVIESTCPHTGQPIRIELTPDQVARIAPPDAVVSAVRPTGKIADVRASACRPGHFFSSPAAAAQWAHEPPTATSTPSRRPSGSTGGSSRSSVGPHTSTRLSNRPTDRRAPR